MCVYDMTSFYSNEMVKMLVLISFGDIVDVFMSSLRRQTLKSRALCMYKQNPAPFTQRHMQIQIYIRY